jgi:hypothetical protein
MGALQDRAAVIKALRAGGAKMRRGHLRLQAGELFWYADPRVDGAGVRQRLVLEVGCWLPSLTPEPDGGAVDCPLLVDVDVTDDPVGRTAGLLAELAAVGDLPALVVRLEEWPDALVDPALRAVLP